MNSPLSPQDIAAFAAMADRYFDAMTTPEEEAALRLFLTLPESHDKRFDDLRATMSFLAVGKAQHRPAVLPSPAQKTLIAPLRTLRRWGIAAALIALLGTGIYWWGSLSSPYVMYAHGRKITNEAAVMTEMESVLSEVLATEAQPAIDAQLSEIFNP